MSVSAQMSFSRYTPAPAAVRFFGRRLPSVSAAGGFSPLAPCAVPVLDPVPAALPLVPEVVRAFRRRNALPACLSVPSWLDADACEYAELSPISE